MRQRLFAAVAGLGLISAIVGCHHTAGVCDCDHEGYGCACCGYGEHYGSIPSDGHVVSSVPIAAPLPSTAAPPVSKPAETVPAPAQKMPPGDSVPNKE